MLRAYALPTIHKSYVWRVIAFLVFMVTSIWAALRAGQVDVIMGTSPPIFQTISAWLVAWVRRRPFLLEIRDLWPEFAIDIGILTNPILIWASRRLESFLYARSTHILVNSPAYREYLIERDISTDKISFIPNGVDTSMFDPQARGEQIRRQLGLDGKFVVTYAGALGLANNIETILLAAKHLEDQPRKDKLP